MRLGIFMQPSHPPERPLADAIEQDLTIIEWCDQLGYSEVWMGEHLTAPWEPVAALDLVLAQAIPRTEQITLCAGAYLLPYYHPAELAMRISQLDHMARGRFICGIAAGSVPTDFAMTDIDAASGQNREMMRESFEIMKKLWTESDTEWEYVGKYWTVRNPPEYHGYGPYTTPYQRPYPPIGVAGLSPRSETIRWAGEQGAIPLSLTFSVPHLKGHWDMMEEGAAAAGRTCNRDDWRVIRTVFVAETDAEARKWVRDGLHARHWVEANFNVLRSFDWLKYLKHDPDVSTDTIDVDYLLEHLWLVGSPDTVTGKLREMNEELGGFGSIIITKYDYGDDPDTYHRSLRLLAEEVMPALG